MAGGGVGGGGWGRGGYFVDAVRAVPSSSG